MADRYKGARQRANANRRNNEVLRDTYCFANVGRWIHPPQDAVCVSCRCGFTKWDYATLIAENGVEAYKHHSGIDCSNAMYAWRQERREALRK